MGGVMSWDPAVTKVLVLVGVMVAFVVALHFKKKGQPEAPPLELAYPNAAWGPVLEAGERIEAQVPVLQPVSWWWRQIFNGPFSAWNVPRQLALTSSGALLVAERGAGNLSDRRRYQIMAIRVEGVKNQGAYCVSLRLLLPQRKLNLHQVPRPFLEQFRSKGGEIVAPTVG
jgi:hypothetical protein